MVSSKVEDPPLKYEIPYDPFSFALYLIHVIKTWNK